MGEEKIVKRKWHGEDGVERIDEGEGGGYDLN